MAKEPPRLPEGRAPWDTVNGFRVGALAGGALGVVVVAFTGWANFWLVLVFAAVGGAIGYLTERRNLRQR